MALRNILVHLDSGDLTQGRLRFAAALASRHQARLVGVFAQFSAPYRVGVVSTWPSEEYRQAREASQAAFEQATRSLAAAQWVDLNRGGEQEILRLVTDLSRHFDMIVLGQHDPVHSAQVPSDLCEEVIMESGRPVLVLPFAGRFHEVGRRPFVAWTDSRAAARALNDALPLIAAGSDTLVVSVVRSENAGAESIAMAAAHLECHGIKAQTEELILQDFGRMDLLLSRVADHCADVMITGAFGGDGSSLFSRGGSTRFLLRHMTVPVLFSH